MLQSLIITDYDGGMADELPGLPSPSWTALTPHTRSGHIVYVLGAPVCLSNAAHRRPVNLLARIEAGLTKVLGGDPAFAGRITKTPQTIKLTFHCGAMEKPSMGSKNSLKRSPISTHYRATTITKLSPSPASDAMLVCSNTCENGHTPDAAPTAPAHKVKPIGKLSCMTALSYATKTKSPTTTHAEHSHQTKYCISPDQPVDEPGATSSVFSALAGMSG